MPRNRTVRFAVLGSSVQRAAAASGHSQNRSNPVKRRAIVAVLVIASLVLITVSFRSSALNGVEGAGASALRPFQTAADRVARPFRDASSWTRGLFDAKAENRKLRVKLQQATQLDAEEKGAIEESKRLEKLLNYAGSPKFPEDYDKVATQVLTSPTALDQSVVIAAGTNRGIALQDVVVTNDGLVGQVTRVFAGEARVTLITDAESSVSAADENNQSAIGIVDHGSATNSLVLDGVTKDKQVSAGDTIVTEGSLGNGKLPSLYPRNIIIGTVTAVDQNDTDIDKDIQIQPSVDFSSLQSVLVLIPKVKKTTGR